MKSKAYPDMFIDSNEISESLRDSHMERMNAFHTQMMIKVRLQEWAPSNQPVLDRQHSDNLSFHRTTSPRPDISLDIRPTVIPVQGHVTAGCPDPNCVESTAGCWSIHTSEVELCFWDHHIIYATGRFSFRAVQPSEEPLSTISFIDLGGGLTMLPEHCRVIFVDCRYWLKLFSSLKGPYNQAVERQSCTIELATSIGTGNRCFLARDHHAQLRLEIPFCSFPGCINICRCGPVHRIPHQYFRAKV